MIYRRRPCQLQADGTCPKCGKKRACGVWWYKFMWGGKTIRESTFQGSDKVARKMEAKHKTSLALGEVGLRDKRNVETLGEFIEERFEPWAKKQYEKTSPETWKAWYRSGLRRIASLPIAKKSLDAITTEDTADFAKTLHNSGLKIASVNSRLRVLRRVLSSAVEWGVIPACAKIKLLRGEEHRERVITPLEKARYLAAAPELAREVATILFETGLRPDECFRLRWENIRWSSGRQGTFLNGFGKTKAARRVLPMTPQVRAVLESRWERAGEPGEGFVFAAETKSGHITSSSVKKQHKNTFKIIAKYATEHDKKPVIPFVLYSIRHTFLTRLGESGCDAWTLAKIAGHSSITMSARYVHPSNDSVLNAMDQLPHEGGHHSGHREEIEDSVEGGKKLLPQ